MELCNAPRYAEFIVFCVLACPALLFDEEVLDLLHSVTERVFIISLFRDIVSYCFHFGFVWSNCQ